MCGIAGIVNFGAAVESENGSTLSRLKAMTSAMVHRGPDGEGHWCSEGDRVGLAHRRLAIVDLDDRAAQPMTNRDRSIWITFNGEIYNHMKLRKQLLEAGYPFKTDHSDTEVLVHGYDAWGIEGLLERLEGMFAFAIWDEREQRLTLARDRIGIKPLYFTRTANEFLFASEIKAILNDGSIPRDIDVNAFNHYLSFMIAPAPLTMFKDIFKLPAGHYMQVDGTGRIDARRYWDALPGQGIAPGETEGLSDDQLERFYTDNILQKLEDAISKRMMSDVPFGVFLSGGIDSSANVALMSRMMDRPVETFTVGFKDHPHLNELEHARRIAKEFKTNHHEILIDESDMLGYLNELVHYQDEPIADWVCIPLHFVSKLARDSGVTVVQVGEGSDEQFCGYDSYMTYLRLYRSLWSPYMKWTPGFVRSWIAALAWGVGRMTTRLDRFVEVLHRAGRGRELFWSGANAFWNVHKRRVQTKNGPKAGPLPEWLKQSGLDLEGLTDRDSGATIGAYMKRLRSHAPGAGDFSRMTYNEFRLRLPELLLMRVDKIGMASSIEGRVPFLDHKLVEFTRDIPKHWQTRGGESKYLLKRALTDLLPKEILYRKKMGFAAPMAEWLRGEFGAKAEAAVLSSGLMRRNLLDKNHVARMFRQHRSGKADHALHLWTLFNVAAWYDHWIEKGRD